LSAILGAAPMGLYIITVEGPHKLRRALRFYIWTEIALHGWQPYYLPGPHGAETVISSLSLSPAHRAIVQPGAEGVAVAHDHDTGRYKVTVAPESSEAPLFLEAPQAQGETVRVALHIRIGRLRWKLTTDEDASEWSTMPVRLPADKLTQSRSSYLTIELSAEEWPAICLTLQDVGSTDGALQASDWRKPQRGQQRLHLPLDEYRDTLRQLLDCPVFMFSLSIRNDSTDLKLPVLYLNREPGLTVVLLEWTPDGATNLHWEAQHRLRNRRVRLWSGWQPWTQPYEFPIPDDVAATALSDEPGSGMLPLPVCLLRGWYWVDLRTAPIWEELSAPQDPSPGAMLARNADPIRRLLELRYANPTSAEQEYLVHFERACILDAMNDDAGCQAEVQWLFGQHAQADPDMLYSVYRWLRARNNPTAPAIRMHMFAPEKVARVLSDDKFASLRSSYMEAFADNTTPIKPESALLILDSKQYPGLENRALQILLKRDAPKAVKLILERVSEGALSEQDALHLLNIDEQIEFSLQTLRTQPASPVRDRIIRKLAQRATTVSLVTVGAWIHTEAGWGRIERISLQGKDQEWFDPNNETPELVVVLRPTHSPIHVLVDLSNRKMTFPKQPIYHCRKESGCDGFISIEQADVTYAHYRAAHNGSIQPVFLPIDSDEYKWLRPPTYHRQPPANEFQ